MSRTRKPKIVDRALLMPDVHLPYQDKVAFACFLRVLSGGRFKKLVGLGDLADCYHVSSFDLDPRRVIGDFEEECELVCEGREEIDEAAKRGRVKDKILMQGNHEVRIDRYMVKNAPKMAFAAKNWIELFGLAEAGWVCHPYKTSIQLGNLRITHDIERAGVYAARQSQLDMGCSVAFGHTHRLQVHYQGTVDGPRHVGITCGWLGDPEFIDYKHRDKVRRDSIHGFATVNVLDDGTFWAQAIPIINGRAVVDGEVY